jgi:hypothetical protein
LKNGLVVAAALLGGLAGPVHAEPGLLASPRLAVETPRDGDHVAASDSTVFVAGRALYGERAAELFDLAIVLDLSKSTDAPCGIDLDGDGHVGQAPQSIFTDGSSDDFGDSVLAAEVAAAHALIEQLDPRTTRVALISFSGDSDPKTADARTLIPLGTDYAATHRALDELLEDWPTGRTNVAAALNLATAELIGSASAQSSPRSDAVRVILLLTDGQPTLPVPFEPAQNVERARVAASLAVRAGIRIDTFAIGEEANQDVTMTASLAAMSGGRFTPVLEPSELVSTFEQLRLADLRDVDVRNLTTGVSAEEVLIESDGRFAALVPLADGENQLEISAQVDDGRLQRRVRVLRTADQRPPVLEARWIPQRTRLLEQRLHALRRRELLIEMEQERARSVDVSVEGEAGRAVVVPASATRSVEVTVER